MKHLVWALCLLGAPLTPAIATAHGPRAARHIEVVGTDNGVRTQVTVEHHAMQAALGVPVTEANIVGPWLRRGLLIDTNKGACTIASASNPFLQKKTNTVVTNVRWTCPAGSRSVWLTDETLLAAEPDMKTFVKVGRRELRLTGAKNRTKITR